MINSLRIRRFGPYSNSSNMQVWSTSNRRSGPNLRNRIVCDHVASNQYEFAGLVYFFEEKKVDQTCFGMHMPSRDGEDSGPNVRPPCTVSKINDHKSKYKSEMSMIMSQVFNWVGKTGFKTRLIRSLFGRGT